MSCPTCGSPDKLRDKRGFTVVTGLLLRFITQEELIKEKIERLVAIKEKRRLLVEHKADIEVAKELLDSFRRM